MAGSAYFTLRVTGDGSHAIWLLSEANTAINYGTIEADGFNRQEIFNLYSNPFTTPSRIFNEREQYLLMREKFKDDTLLADLKVEKTRLEAEFRERTDREGQDAARSWLAEAAEALGRREGTRMRQLFQTIPALSQPSAPA